MNKLNEKSLLLQVIGAVVCFILFAVGMTHTGEGLSIFVFFGIVGLTGFIIFINRIVSTLQHSKTNNSSLKK